MQVLVQNENNNQKKKSILLVGNPYISNQVANSPQKRLKKESYSTKFKRLFQEKENEAQTIRENYFRLFTLCSK